MYYPQFKEAVQHYEPVPPASRQFHPAKSSRYANEQERLVATSGVNVLLLGSSLSLKQTAALWLNFQKKETAWSK